MRLYLLNSLIPNSRIIIIINYMSIPCAIDDEYNLYCQNSRKKNYLARQHTLLGALNNKQACVLDNTEKKNGGYHLYCNDDITKAINGSGWTPVTQFFNATSMIYDKKNGFCVNTVDDNVYCAKPKNIRNWSMVRNTTLNFNDNTTSLFPPNSFYADNNEN